MSRPAVFDAFGRRATAVRSVHPYFLPRSCASSMTMTLYARSRKSDCISRSSTPSVMNLMRVLDFTVVSYLNGMSDDIVRAVHNHRHLARRASPFAVHVSASTRRMKE